jgi:hypothetical protein
MYDADSLVKHTRKGSPNSTHQPEPTGLIIRLKEVQH